MKKLVSIALVFGVGLFTSWWLVAKENTTQNIIFNTIPKSGSVYVSKSLEQGLGYKHMQISPGYVPVDNITYDRISEFYQKPKMLTQEHLDASVFNTQLLKKFTDRIVVNVREPQQVLLSWVHHMNKLHSNGHNNLLDYVAPTPPNDYYSWELSEQIDWNIENFLPNVVAWMEGWYKFKDEEDAKDDGFKVLITKYEDLRLDEMSFYSKILDFYDIPQSKFKFVPLVKDSSVHYRKGDPQEWHRVFSQAQKDRINELVSTDLLHRINKG